MVAGVSGAIRRGRRATDFADPVVAFVLLGSNVEPRDHLRATWQALVRSYRPIRRSSVYQSAAVGDIAAAPYLNWAVAIGGDDLERMQLSLKALEAGMGRNAEDLAAGRCLIDIDILFVRFNFEDRIERRLLKPELYTAAHAFVPMAEIALEEIVLLGTELDAAARASWRGRLKFAAPLTDLKSAH